MSRKLLGLVLLLTALILLTVFYMNLPPPGIERKGGIVLFGLNLNDLVSLLGGVVSLASGVLALTSRKKTGA